MGKSQKHAQTCPWLGIKKQKEEKPQEVQGREGESFCGADGGFGLGWGGKKRPMGKR